MKKVSVFTVLTCFLAGTANLPCYAGTGFSKAVSNIFNSDDNDSPKTVVTMGPNSLVGGSSAQSDSGHLKPKPSDDSVPDFTATFDDTPPMTAAELARFEELARKGQIPGFALSQPDYSQHTVLSVHGPVGGEGGESLSQSTMPSPNPAPSPTISTLVLGSDIEKSGVPSPSPASSSRVIDDERIKGHDTLFLYAPQNAVVVEKENYRLAKVALLCVVTEWKNLAEAAKHPSMRKLIDEQTPEQDITRLYRGVKWAKYYLAKKGKEQKKPEAANGFTQLIEARMNGLIEEIRQSIELKEEPSVSIRFQQDTINEKFMFSVEENLGKVILVEIPGQEL